MELSTYLHPLVVQFSHCLNEVICYLRESSASGAPVFTTPKQTTYFLLAVTFVFSRLIFLPFTFTAKLILEFLNSLMRNLAIAWDATILKYSPFNFADAGDGHDNFSSQGAERKNKWSGRGDNSSSWQERMTAKQNIYSSSSVLGVKPAADIFEIKSAYRSLMKKNHPDRFMRSSPYDQERAQQVTLKIRAAYDQMMTDTRET